MEGEVAISCDGVEHQFSIDDVSPDILKDTFELRSEPKTLYRCDNNLVIPLKKWQSNLTPGCSYYIKSGGVNQGQEFRRDESLGEVILHSLIASTAVYHISNETDGEDDCKKYLLEQLENHHFEYVIRSKYGENVYIIAKEIDTSRIYIAFRGTKELSDWQYNLQAAREASGSSLISGKFHSGFLQRAQLFPLHKILHEETFKDFDVIVCGHSLGGAIASIVAIRLIVEKARYKLQGKVKCITFGAPFFGDAMLQKSVNCKDMYHFVCNNDPVPRLLNYTQSAASIVNGLETQISSLAQQFSTEGGISYHKKNTQDLIDKKLRYKEVLPKLTSLIGSVFEATTVLYPGVKWAADVTKMLSVVSDINSSVSTKQNVYVPIGNFYFLDNRRQLNKSYQWNDQDSIQVHIENYFQNHSADIKTDDHALTNYVHLLQIFNDPRIPFDCYPTYLDDAYHSDFVVPECRNVEFRNPYDPIIHSTKLVKVEDRDRTFLRLSFTGRHLFGIVLQMCQFHFSFPFATNPDTTTIKRLSMGENIQKVVLEVPYKESVSISDHGSLLVYVTQFGVCEKIIRREDLRDLVIQSVAQISLHDSVSLVVRRAIQRGMALSKIKQASGGGSSNLIIEEVKELSDIALGYEAMKQIQLVFNDNEKDFNFILSNEEAFGKVKEVSDKIENYLRSPMEIQAEWSVMQKIAFGLTVAAGTAAVGYIAGPGLVMVGLANAASATATTVGGMFGFFAASASANALMRDKLTDSVYENALKWINQQLLEAKEKTLNSDVVFQIFDLQEDGSIYSHEKILMLLTEGNNSSINNFGDSVLSKCTEKTKEIVRHRINAIKKIHKIREIFSQQCFIGIVGLQDAGKTTLLRKMWGVGGKTGFFTHTDVPQLYEITSRLLVVDFPGSNSLDYHAKTFSICGAMNNMVIVVIPFSGDISRVISDELQNVFGVMRGSDSTKVLLCVNKCGLYLERLKDELKDHDSPVQFLKKRFMDKLNEHYENSGKGIVVGTDDILFTDWEVGDRDEVKNFGISGVEEIKSRIKTYLINYGIYKEEEKDELRKCISISTQA